MGLGSQITTHWSEEDGGCWVATHRHWSVGKGFAPRAEDATTSRREIPSGNDIVGYLSDHPEGLRLGEMEAYFDVPRRELSEVVNQLAEDDSVRLDEDHQLYYPAEDEDAEVS